MLSTTTTAARALQPVAPIRPKATPMRENRPASKPGRKVRFSLVFGAVK